MDESHESPPAFIPAQPVLFLAAGSLAANAVSALPAVTDGLRLRISGPFGVLRLISEQDEIRQQIRIAQRVPWDEDQPPDELPPETRDEQVRSLVRTLMSASGPLPVSPTRRRCLQVYAVLDLRDVASVDKAVELLRTMRLERVGFDVTAIVLTGRCAQFHRAEVDWQKGRAALEKANKEDCLFQRLYFMDGKNAHQYWLQTEEDQARMAAEFMLHHGLSPYSNELRQNEASRFLTRRQPLAEVCGTFSCRTLHTDNARIARTISEVLSRRLFGGTRELPTAEDAREIAAIAEDLTKQLNVVLRQADQPGGPAATVRAQLAAALERVCKARPVRRIPAFLDAMLEKLKVLKMQALVRRERQLRKEVAERFRGAVRPRPASVYVEVPSQNWMWHAALACFATGWAGAATVLVFSSGAWSLPIVAVLFLTGLCALERATRHREFTASPIDAGETAPAEEYLRRLTWRERAAGLLLALGGAAIVGSAQTISPEGVPVIGGSALASVFVATATFAAGLIVLMRRSYPPDSSVAEEPDDLAGRRPTRRRVAGAVLLAGVLGWVMWSWPIAFRPDFTARLLAGVGLALCAAGMVFLSHPRSGMGRFLGEGEPTMNLGGTRSPAVYWDPRSDQILARLQAWCAVALLPDSPVVAADHLDWPDQRRFGTILDAVAGDWPEQLATACQKEAAAGIKDANHWIQYMIDAFDDPAIAAGDNRHAIVHHTVCKWLSRHSWQQLVNQLGKSGPSWFAQYVDWAVVPLWPDKTSQWDQDVSLAVMQAEMLPLVRPSTERETSYRVAPIEWPAAGTVVIVRRVQGAPEGLFGEQLPRGSDETTPDDGDSPVATTPALAAARSPSDGAFETAGNSGNGI